MNSDNINQFWTNFNSLCLEIKQLYVEISKNEDYNEIQKLKDKINQCQELVSISAVILPKYDVKRSQQVS